MPAITWPQCFSPLSFQIASSLSKELCALVFGINTFLATVLKTVITLLVSDKRGLGLRVREQVSPIFSLTFRGGNPLCGHSKASWHPHFVIPSQGAQIHCHGSVQNVAHIGAGSETVGTGSHFQGHLMWQD